MNEQEYLARWKWIDPTKGYPDDTLIPGVKKVTYRHVAASIGATHKSVDFMEPRHEDGLERIDDLDWRIFGVSLEGTVDGVEYVWGMFVLGMGMFHVQIVKEHTRELTETERDAWSKKTLSMVGSHTGKTSYTMPSGVAPPSK